jgi:outer membrane protein TolC
MLAIVALLVTALPAPLDGYLKAAADNNRTLQISRAQLAEQQAQVQQAISGLTPTLQATGSYVRNQYQADLPLPNAFFGIPGGGTTTILIQPYDQLQATISLNVPLIEPTAIAKLAGQKHAAAGAEQATLASVLDVQLSVAQTYYQIIAAQGVLAAANHSLKTAQDALAISQRKFEAGTANKLTVDRAQVDVARSQQTVADAQRALGVARRSLETLSGMPVPGDLPAVEEGSLPSQGEDFYVDAAVRQRPEVAQVRETISVASAARTAAWALLAPSLLGQAQEHLANYSGFVGRDGYWTLGLSLSWVIDPVGTHASLHLADATLAEDEARLNQALDTVRDDVHTAWLQVVADESHVHETKAEVASAQEGLKLTQEQFAAGTATSLDLSQAERDAFTAEANAAQSASDFASALLALQKASGTPLLVVEK